MPRLATSLVLLALGCACTSKSAASPPSAQQPADDRSTETGTEPTIDGGQASARGPQPVSAARIEITSAQAKAAGLPALGFSLDTAGTGMSGSQLGNGEYLRLSGPPGGPLALRISPTTLGHAFAPIDGVQLVETQTELLGQTRRAAAWISGEGHARTSWCAVIVAPPGAEPGAPALLLEVGIGHQGDETGCATALESPQLGPVVRSLELEQPR